MKPTELEKIVLQYKNNNIPKPFIRTDKIFTRKTSDDYRIQTIDLGRYKLPPHLSN